MMSMTRHCVGTGKKKVLLAMPPAPYISKPMNVVALVVHYVPRSIECR